MASKGRWGSRDVCLRVTFPWLRSELGSSGAEGRASPETCGTSWELAAWQEVSRNLPLSLRVLLGAGEPLLSSLDGVMNGFWGWLGSNMVTGFYDLGMSFAFAARAAWVTYDLGAGGGGLCGFLLLT